MWPDAAQAEVVLETWARASRAALRREQELFPETPTCALFAHIQLRAPEKQHSLYKMANVRSGGNIRVLVVSMGFIVSIKSPPVEWDSPF